MNIQKSIDSRIFNEETPVHKILVFCNFSRTFDSNSIFFKFSFVCFVSIKLVVVGMLCLPLTKDYLFCYQPRCHIFRPFKGRIKHGGKQKKQVFFVLVILEQKELQVLKHPVQDFMLKNDTMRNGTSYMSSMIQDVSMYTQYMCMSLNQ